MKKKTILTFLSSILLLTAVALPGHAADPIQINPEKELLVVIHDNVMPRARDPWTYPAFANDRYHTLRSAVESALEEVSYPGPVKVVRFAAGLPDAEQVLSLYVYRWQTGIETFGPAFTAEFTLEAVLSVGEMRFGMGTFSARESHVVLGRASAEDYEPAARRAIDQMIEFYNNATARLRLEG